MDELRDAADEPCPRLQRLLGALLQVVLDGDDPFVRELLDLLSVVVPSISYSDGQCVHWLDSARCIVQARTSGVRTDI